MAVPETNPRIKKLIDLLLMEAGEDEFDADHKEWQTFLERVYALYIEELKSPIFPHGARWEQGNPMGITQADQTKFALAMFNTIGKDKNDQIMRDWVRDLFKKEKGKAYALEVEALFPQQIWEVHPDLDLKQIEDAYMAQPNEDAAQRDARHLARTLIKDPLNETQMYSVRALQGRPDKDTENLIENYVNTLKRTKISKQQYVPGREPVMGETPAISATTGGSRYDPSELYNQITTNMPDPLAKRDDYMEQLSQFEQGKKEQLEYLKRNDATYQLLGKTQKRIFENTEERLRRQYDIEMAMKSYDGTYLNYLQDYTAGKVKPWSDKQWDVTIQSVLNSDVFNEWFNEISLKGIDPAKQQAIEGVSKEITPTEKDYREAGQLGFSVIANPQYVKQWIIQKQTAGMDPSIRSYMIPAIEKDLNDFELENFAEDKLMYQQANSGILDSSLKNTANKNMAIKYMKEWQDRNFNWMSGKSSTAMDEEKKLKKAGFVLPEEEFKYNSPSLLQRR